MDSTLVISAYTGSGIFLMLALIAILPEPTIVPPPPCLGTRLTGILFRENPINCRQACPKQKRFAFPDKPP